MAWRIDENVVRGEIENCTRGRITGRIWLVDRPEPIELDLAGNAWRDLAGRRLNFVNPTPVSSGLGGIATRQSGVVGDCTASRKVKVPDGSKEEFLENYRQRKPSPWHWGNSLYLEWFSTANGRVVIESASYQLTIGPESTWDMTEPEEEAQRRANAESLQNFMGRLESAASDAAGTERSDKSEKTGDASMDRPMTEAEAEEMQAESDELVDRIQARMEREGPGADLGKILDEELARRARERGEEPLASEDDPSWPEDTDVTGDAADDALAATDPELEAELKSRHPLAEEALRLASRLLREPEQNGWIGRDAHEEHPLVDIATAASKACAKLGGALNGYRWPPSLGRCAGTIVRLKRARTYLDDALRAAEAAVAQALAPLDWLHEIERALNAMAEQCDLLIGELREMLARGFE